MIRRLIEGAVQFRNPHFRIHPAVNGMALLSFIWTTVWSLVRGLIWIFHGKQPGMAIHGKGVEIYNSPKISFGKYLKLGNHTFLSALGTEGITLGNNVGIGAYSRLVVSQSFDNPGTFIRIGNHVGIGEFAYLGGAGGLEIGDECIIGQYFSCHPENHIAEDSTVSIRHQGVTRKGIKIGSNCWIGSKVSILDGVEIGDGCIIAAGAVVNKSFPANCVLGGVPAKMIKSRT